MTEEATVTPGERAEALSAAVELGGPHLDPEPLAAASRVLEKVQGRLRHGTQHTVVALAGPTGAGKSSLFNAMCEEAVSTTGVRRPTTGAAHACVWGPSADGLLDWLGITRRHHVAGRTEVGAVSDLDGLVLVDLPDFDSTETDHRVEVDRLVELVDMLVWVTDPQKYADESLHSAYLVPLAGHGHVMRFVLNKTDTLAADQTDLVVDDFATRLRADGIAAPEVLPVSMVDGTGLPALREMLHAAVSGRRAAVARIEADIAGVATGLSSEGRARRIDSGDERKLVAALSHAAGADTVATLTAAQHRRDAADAMGWPPLLWVRRRRRHPVADLPRVSSQPASEAEVAAALRAIAERAADGLTAPWPAACRRVARARQDDVVEALTTVTSDAARGQRGRPRWWSAVAWIQRALLAAASAGLVWLLAVAVLGGFLRLDTDPLLIDTPGLDWIPLPSLLLVGGVAAGLLTGGVGRLFARVGAKRRARRAAAAVRRRVVDIARHHVVAPLRATLDDRSEIERLLATASGR